MNEASMAGPLVVVSDPLPFVWGAIARAAATPALVVVTTDLGLDLRHDDPRAAFEALGAALVGPASGGATRGTGTIGLATRIGPGFVHAVSGLDVREAIDLGLGWGLDEAAVMARWIEAGVSAIGLVAPRPSARLSDALALAAGHVPVVVLDPAGRDWSSHGAATVASLAALRLALSLPREATAAGPIALVGTSRVALEIVRAALTAAGITLRAASDAAREAIAQEVHALARLGVVNDLTPAATARHVAHATSVLAAEGPALVVDGALAADPLALVDALIARRATIGKSLDDLVPVPELDASRAHALVAAARLTKQRTLEREHALAIAAAVGLGRPAPTLHVSSAGAAHGAAGALVRSSDDRRYMGAPGVPARKVIELETTWEEIARDLATTDPWAARWLAVAPEGVDFTLTIARDGVGPVARWSLAAGDGVLTLPARARGLPADLPATLFGAASAAALALGDLELLTVRGVARDGAVVLVDATASLVTEEEA